MHDRATAATSRRRAGAAAGSEDVTFNRCQAMLEISNALRQVLMMVVM